MENLRAEIEKLIAERLKGQDANLVSDDYLKKNSLYPFNRIANQLFVLMTNNKLQYNEYAKLRDEYFIRNPYLKLFEEGPRTFGQTELEEKLIRDFELVRPQNNPKYDLSYHLDGNKEIKIEVKSSRVVESDSTRLIVERGYKKPKGNPEEVSKAIGGLKFEMNFQQLKPSCCDVFIWIAVWLDELDFWVIPSSKIVEREKNSPRRKLKDSIVRDDGTIVMGTQHEGGKDGKVSEGEIFVTNNHYCDLNMYSATADNLIQKIKDAYENGKTE